MAHPFDPAARSVFVTVIAVGPRRNHTFRCALDTGTTQTVLPALVLRRMGYDLSHPLGWTRIRSATGVARVPLLRLSALAALDCVRTDFLVAAHDLPLGVQADGLLGLDFFRGLALKLDFARGRITLGAPRRWWQFWR
jgi:hypothetical protein